MGINQKENIRPKGYFKIIETDINTGKKTETIIENLTTTILQTALADVLTGDYDADKHVIGYLAVGDDDTAVSASDTELGNQLGDLKSYVPNSLHNDTAATTAEATFYFDVTEAEYYGTWNEIGLYAANGTDLLTHALIDPAKTFNNTKTMTVHYLVEF